MPKILSGLLILVVGGVLGWLTLRNAGSYVGQLPKGLAEASLYQGQVVRLREALVGYQAEVGVLPSLEGKAVVASLLGENRLRKRFLDAPWLKFDAAGAPVDPWGRVYRFEGKDGRVELVEEGAK
ncbi:hypothetical protein BH09VER1_BH09VER1_06660 [soil metagenome]